LLRFSYARFDFSGIYVPGLRKTLGFPVFGIPDTATTYAELKDEIAEVFSASYLRQSERNYRRFA